MTSPVLGGICAWLRGCFGQGPNPPSFPGEKPPRVRSNQVLPTFTVLLGSINGTPIGGPGTPYPDEVVIDAGPPLGRVVLRRAFSSDPKLLDQLVERSTKEAERSGIRGFIPLQFRHYYTVSAPPRGGIPPFDFYCALRTWAARNGAMVSYHLPTQPAAPVADYLYESSGIGVIATQPPPPQRLQYQGVQLDGSGQRLVDIQHAWVSPAQLQRVSAQQVADLAGHISRETPDGRTHGAATLGVILGGTAHLGTMPTLPGIAPLVDYLTAPSWVANRDENGAIVSWTEKMLETLEKAWIALSQSPSGVGTLLLEVDNGASMPIEAVPELFVLLQNIGATHRVIEPAGNASIDLSNETFEYDVAVNGVVQRRTRTMSAVTSGALLVAAGRTGVLEAPFGDASSETNFGSPIDCWAWGDSIQSVGARLDPAGWVTIPDLGSVPGGFAAQAGTSGAAAIVAGAVVLMQQVRRLATNPAKVPLTRPQIIDLINRFGRPGVNDLIGKRMPNLRATGFLEAVAAA